MTEGEVPEDEYLIPLGQADIKREGSDVTIVTYSYMTLKCLEAAEILEGKGINVEVIDLRTLVPLDKECILNSVEKTGRLVIVNEACKRGSVASDIAAIVVEEAFDSLDSPIIRVAGKNTTIPFNLRLEKACIPAVEDVVNGVMAALES
jgi:pyruvate dehydrogenase E1 component beta subunit